MLLRYLLFLSLALILGADFAQAGQPRDDVQMGRGKRAVVLHFELIDNRIFIPVKLNGHGPYLLMVDTGASNIVTPQVAAEIGAPKRESFSATGVGESSERAWHTSVNVVEVAEIRATAQSYLVIPLERIRQFIGFERFDGVIGYDFLRRFAVSINYDRRTMTLTLPDSYRPPARAASVPFTLNGNIPQVDGWVDGRRGALKIDTGDRSSLTLYVPFVEQNGLRAVYRRKVEAVTGYGIGGPVPAEVVRVGSVRLGGYEVTRVVARMPQLRQGAYMDPTVMGSVGTKSLRWLKVTFDYTLRRIYLEPSEKFNEPDVFDKLGGWYSRHGTGLELTTLTQGGAAGGVESRRRAARHQRAEVGDNVSGAIAGVSQQGIYIVDSPVVLLCRESCARPDKITGAKALARF
jgi:hypothetical protein